MQKTTLGITALSLSAAMLAIANFTVRPTPAVAAEVVTGRDYQAATARAQTGGEALYILDNKTGQIAVFAYDSKTRDVRLRVVGFVSSAFEAR